MAQSDSTKEHILAYVHMRTVRRVLECLLDYVVKRGNEGRSLDQYIEDNDRIILKSEMGIRNRKILFPRQHEVQLEEIPLYVIEFLIQHTTDCTVVPIDIKRVLHELTEIRKESHTCITKGVDDASFDEHLEKVKQQLGIVCKFMHADQLQREIDDLMVDIHLLNMNNDDDCFGEFKHHHEIEKSYREKIAGFTDDQQKLHSMIEKVISITEADEKAAEGNQRDHRDLNTDKYPIKLTEAIIEFCHKRSGEISDAQLNRDIANIVNNQDERVVLPELKDRGSEIRTLFQDAFSDFGEVRAKQGCVLIIVKPRSVQLMFQLFEECANGQITEKMRPLEEMIRGIPNYKNYELEAVLYRDHYDHVLGDIASQMSHLFIERNMTLTKERKVTNVELSNNDTILLTVQCHSVDDRHEFENAVRTGQFLDTVRALNEKLNELHDGPNIAFDASVLERTNAQRTISGDRVVEEVALST